MKRQMICAREVVFVILLMASTSLAQRAKYDGNWWLSRPVAEQEQFLWGYTDCEWDTLGLRVEHWGRRYLDYTKLRLEITRRYQEGQLLQTKPVGAAMHEVLQNPGAVSATRPGGGEHSTDKHGFLDGLYWKGGTAEKKRGFIEGEVACFKAHPQSGKDFSKGIEDYVELVTKWYSAAQNSEDAKVADVLVRFADKPHHQH